MTRLNVPALPSGAQIGVYEIKNVISSDWSSVLYRAWNEHLNTMVALKEYFPSDYAEREENGTTVKAKSNKDVSVYAYGMEKFLELAELLVDIQQTSIVSVHNILQFNGTAYMAMDLVKGSPLSELQDSPYSNDTEESKQIFRSLLNGLQAVHDKNIIHGNINPSNILIKKNGEPVLVNFASASIALSDHCKQIQQTFTSGFTYSKTYHPDDLSSFRSDLYSLGASMFFHLTGNDPATFIDREETFNSNDSDPCLVALEQVVPLLDKSLSKATLSMLNLNPEYRPQSAVEILTRLNQESEEHNSQKEKILKFNTEKSRANLFLPGLAGLATLIIAGTFWFSFQQLPEIDVSVNDKSQTFQQPIVVVEEENTIEELVEKLDSAKPPPVKFIKDENKKAGQIEIIVNNSHSLVGTIESRIEGQFSEESPENLIIDNSEIQLATEQNEKINHFLLVAKKNVDLFNLTTPLDNNAYDQYQAVLSIDQNNTQAIDGLQRIFNIYTGFVENSLTKGDFNSAWVYIKRAKAIQPDAPELPLLRKKFRAMKRQWKDDDILKENGFVAKFFYKRNGELEYHVANNFNNWD